MTTSNRSASHDQQVYRALSSPVRARLLEVLRAEADLDAGALAERLELHVNTVRTHLNLLETPTAPRSSCAGVPSSRSRHHQDVVCAVHLGLMRGALGELGVDVHTRDLIPWADPGACIAPPDGAVAARVCVAVVPRGTV